MSSFNCEFCGALCSDSPIGYVTGCEHYPPDVNPLQADMANILHDTLWDLYERSEKKDQNEAACGGSALTAELGYAPMSEKELHDAGPWTVSPDGGGIQSDDFTHDVILRVTGDFYNDAQRKAYADNLAAKLNAGLAVPNA